MIFAALLVFGFFLGAIPVGVLVGRAKGVDIRQVGSGNVGATNVKRALGPKWGYVVFGLDLLKGLIPSLAGTYLLKERVGGLDLQTQAFLCGLAAVLGHAKSPFLGFKGGKGVSTAMGAGLGAVPLVALIAFSVFVVVLAVGRYMSVASIVGVGLAPVLGATLPGYSRQVVVPLALLAVAVIWLHRANVGRLRAGTEPRFSFGREKGG